MGNVQPHNPLDEVRRLAANEDCCEFYSPVLAELRRRNLDTDDLRDILRHELGEIHCFKSEKTKKHYPETISDYYSIWIDACESRMFIKLLLIDNESGSRRLVVTSFKEDDRYGM